MTAKSDNATPRERFLAIMRYKPVERLPVLALEPFETTAIERWRREGLPEDTHPVDSLGMSRPVNVPVNFGPIPPFEHKVIFEEAVIAGPDDIDREIERLMPLIREGGFIPALDDMASPDMSFSHYRYMIERLQGILLL